MISFKKRTGKTALVFLLILFGFLINPLNILPVKAEENGSALISAKDIINSSVFLDFKKGEDSEKGRFITSCWYIPTENLVNDYSYGVIIFPKLYMERFGIYDNYIESFEAISRAILESEFTPADIPNGLIKCAIGHILEKNMSLEFTFILFVKGTNGTAYSEPHFGTYNEMKDRDYTNTQLMSMANRKLGMRDNFNEIILKLNELVDSVWIYMILGFTTVISAWGVFIGVKVAVAKKKEEKVDARSMVKNLIIGTVVLFVIAFALPLLIKGLAGWTGAYIPETADIVG